MFKKLPSMIFSSLAVPKTPRELTSTKLPLLHAARKRTSQGTVPELGPISGVDPRERLIRVIVTRSWLLTPFINHGMLNEAVVSSERRQGILVTVALSELSVFGESGTEIARRDS